MYNWVVEGSLAILAPDCQTGQIEFVNLAENWFCQSGNTFYCLAIWQFHRLLANRFPPGGLAVLFGLCNYQIARLKHLPDWPDCKKCQTARLRQIACFARLARLGPPDWRQTAFHHSGSSSS